VGRQDDRADLLGDRPQRMAGRDQRDSLVLLVRRVWHQCLTGAACDVCAAAGSISGFGLRTAAR
jgi:hypothetical protein